MESKVIQAVALGFVLGYLGFLFCKKTTKIWKSNHYKFVIAVRTDILLTKNKTALHCSRASVECYKKALLIYPEVVCEWERNYQPKIVLKIDKNGKEEMLHIHRKAESLGLVSVLIKEEHDLSNNYTVIGIGPGSEELINEVTGHLKLL